ncbi:uncharacterized protein LOC142355819 [Convolutriloba macropyga]|uniref:uncharacterized protein LOC142355819 n=1 Tax=Convolutriloba macropyga TaxID=536237 RepID=UPI003F51C32B
MFEKGSLGENRFIADQFGIGRNIASVDDCEFTPVSEEVQHLWSNKDCGLIGHIYDLPQLCYWCWLNLIGDNLTRFQIPEDQCTNTRPPKGELTTTSAATLTDKDIDVEERDQVEKSESTAAFDSVTTSINALTDGEEGKDYKNFRPELLIARIIRPISSVERQHLAKLVITAAFTILIIC